MAKRWTKQDETYLKRYADRKATAELAERFKTDSDTVTAKLQEMGLAAKDSIVPLKLEHDPGVKVYAAGVQAVHHGKWADARKRFRELLDETDQPELAARARQFLAVCEERLDKKPEADDDPFLIAVYERNRGNLEAALEICGRGGRQGRDERFAYLAASLLSLMGEAEKAAKQLEVAIEMNPKNRVHAYYDSDFATLFGDGEYASLFAGE
jgi:tetratricopeptide (TPR) repeat protein